MGCIKCLACIFNLLFALSGLLILLVGSMVHFNYAHYSNFVSDQIWTVPIILMLVGGAVTFICCLGVCGVLTGNSCMILWFAILTLLLFLLEIILGISCYVKHTSLKSIMEVQFNTTMEHVTEREDYYDAWTLLQTELVCCGTYGPNDWEELFANKTFPPSCCQMINLNEADVCTIAQANPDGCFQKLLNMLDEKALVLAGVVLGVAGIQILTIIYACCCLSS